jgi:hypothetical protein
MTPRGVGRNLEAVEDICFVGEEVEVGKGKAAAHLCLTLNIIDLKFSVEHDRVVTTLNIIFCVVTSCCAFHVYILINLRCIPYILLMLLVTHFSLFRFWNTRGMWPFG